MRYTPEEKARMDRLMEIFGEYVQGSKTFEILYSEKVGFIYIDVFNDKPQGFDWIDDYEDLCENLCNEIMNDVRDLKLVGDHGSCWSSPVEIEEARRRITGYLDRIADEEDRAFCFEVMEAFLAENRMKTGKV